MKKLLLTCLSAAFFLTGCHEAYVQDPYKNYEKFSAAELYTRAKASLDKKKYDKAVQDFEALDGLYPFNPYAKQARLDIIAAYHKSGDDDATIVAADRYLHLQPRSKEAEYAYYMKGVASFSRGQSWLQKKFNVSAADRDPKRLLQAYQAFKTVVTAYPNSQYKQDSQERMTYIRSLLAQHELRVADYYYAREAYVAAANRAAKVVSQFKQSGHVADALAMMVKCYRKLHLTDQAELSYARLQKDYPTSKAFLALRQ